MINRKSGFALVEILVSIALTGILLPVIFSSILTSRDGRAQSQQRADAVALLRTTEEQLRLSVEADWDTYAVAGTYHPQASTHTYTLESGSEVIGDLTRSIELSAVQRDSTGAIASIGTTDPSTIKALLRVAWNRPIAQNLTKTVLLTRSLHPAILTQTTQSDFAAGTVTSTQVTSEGDGSVELIIASASGTLTDEYTIASNYTYDSASVEITGGYAQLKNTGSPATGSTTNASFDTDLIGWTFASFGTNVSQTGARVATGGNPNGFARINFPSDKNSIAGGYYYQPFTTTVANPSGSLSFDWKVTAYQGSPDDFRVVAFVDTASSAPTMGQEVWNSGLLTGTNATWSGTGTINIASKITAPGTYYLKFAVYLDYQNVGANKGPYTVGFDNVSLNWSGSTSAYAATSPSVAQISSFQPSGLQAWSTFSAIEVPNGGSVTYQLSDDDGVTWKYVVPVGGWTAASLASQSSSASTINSNLSTFATASGKLRVRAFLNGNGSQQVRLDSISIGYIGVSGSQTGTFTSSTVDAARTVSFHSIGWSGTNTANTTIQFQIATNTDNATWNYVGPDGTASSYFTNSPTAIALGSVAGRYLRYKAFFSTSTTDIPKLAEVTIGYTE